MKKITVSICMIFILFGVAIPASAALTGSEASLNNLGAANEVNLDSAGDLWISDFEAGEVWWVDPHSDQYAVYTTTLYPADARRSGDLFWWVDGGAVPLIGRASVANGAYTLWQVPDGGWLFGTSVDNSGQLWVSDFLLPFIYSLTVNAEGTSGNLCTFFMPNNGTAAYLTYREPYLWVGDRPNHRILRLNVHDYSYDWWQLPDNREPYGMALDDSGNLWFTDQTSINLITGVDVNSYFLTSYPEPQNFNPHMLAVQGNRIWYTIYQDNFFATLDTKIAAHNSPVAVAHTSGTSLTHGCATITPYGSGGSKTPTTGLTWAATTYASAAPADGWQVYTMPNKALPWGIAYNNGKVWLADYGRQKLVEVDAPQEIVLSLEKSATQTTYDSIGDVINYTYRLTNTGSETILAPFTISDDRTVNESCPASPTSLAPGEFITCTSSYTATQADLDAGQVVNTAQGHAFIGTTTVDSNSDSVTVTAVQNKVLTLDKTALPTTYDSLGDLISYSYKLTNSGNVTLTAPFTITDNKTTDESCPASPNSLAPGAYISCTSSYTITQADLDAGQVVNTAQGHAFVGSTPLDSNSDSATVTAVQNTVLTLDKTALPTTYDSVGDVISYSFKLTNDGNVTLIAPFSITDDKTTNESCPTSPTSLAPGAYITCTSSYSITQVDLDAGQVTNTASGHAYFGVTQVNSNQDSATVNAVQAPALILVKTANPLTYNSAGDIITYSFLVTDSGNVRLLGPITITDDKTSNESCPAVTTIGNHDTYLDPGESITCTASYSITQADIDAGSVINTATAHAGAITSNADSAIVTVITKNYALFLPIIIR